MCYISIYPDDLNNCDYILLGKNDEMLNAADNADMPQQLLQLF